MKKLLSLLFVLALLLSLSACLFPSPASTGSTPTSAASTTQAPTPPLIDEDGHYNAKEDVALYIHIYGHLPQNYVTKSQANALGCQSLNQIEAYWEDGAIGGDVFRNREGLLPNKSGRTYYECDIDTWRKNARGAKRIVFSNDGLVYYTEDHYQSFTLLYGTP